MSTESRSKLPLRPNFSVGDKSPQSPPIKLLINHGRPNFIVNRSPKIDVNQNPLSAKVLNSGEEKQKPVFRNPSIRPAKQWVPPTSGPNEPSKVVLRKTNINLIPKVEDEEPELFAVQRRMAENLKTRDFEQINQSRNSYTEVVLTPTSPQSPQFPTLERENVKRIEGNDVSEEVVNISETPVHASEPAEEIVELVSVEAIEVPEAVVENGHQDEEEPEKVQQLSPFVQQLNNMILNGTLSIEKPEEGPLINGNGHTNGHISPEEETPNNVNFEPKTIVSFSKDLSSEPNKYPDTVKTIEIAEVRPDENGNKTLEELAKLKFDIKENENDVIVTSVIRTE